jgi:hypothetical protein
MSYGWSKDAGALTWQVEPVCHQCRRLVVQVDGVWRHRADSTPQCPLGAREAWRRFAMLVTGRSPGP